MLDKIKNRKQEGFTIIEVLIVLAIAGLILLIVFLAVPALQRNSRNTQYKNAAGTLLTALSESRTNNNGALPTACSIAANGDITVTNTGGAVVVGRTQGGYTCVNNAAAKAANDPAGAYNVATGQKCNGTAIAAASRSIAVTYTVETSTGTIPQCVDS
jgi:prepilin-type N-terminal cleavage/methylation domain-containing protein